ncbi:MAG: GNAT family N-acetyltransferase [Dysgonamonadaceae bacterium]|jgi:hypothetical protein|nr:GNAT family N-acetyltransferase [Dysgonamonadaceae bacterium]
MFEAITPENQARWDAIVRSMRGFDFYHLAAYHRLDASGVPLLLHYSDNAANVAFPIILRRIDDTDYRDITSVYGYPSPLTNTFPLPQASLAAFHKQMLRFFDENSVVSAFSRLHPLFPEQEKILEGTGDTINTGFTVAIDLNIPENEQRKQYSHSLKNTLNRLERKNAEVKKAATNAEIEAFAEIYAETMTRLRAPQIYFFDGDYFRRFLKTLPSALYVAYYEGKIIGGALFTDCNGIIQLHLSAARNDCLHLSPLKYIWDQIRLYGVENKRNYLHLGGGVGGSRDSLFAFKAQFSRLHFRFKTWRYVHNREVYDLLVRDKCGGDLPASSFFPLYRMGGCD